MRLCHCIALSFALAVSTFPAIASEISLTPTTLIAKASSRSHAVEVNNLGKDPVAFQVKVSTWSQVDGKDVFTPTSDVVATPAMLTIPAKGRRVARLMRMKGEGNGFYMLTLHELPSPKQTPAVQVQILVKHHLPLVFEGAAGHTLSARRVPGGFVLANAGAGTARVSPHVLDTHGKPLVAENLGWVLPMSERRVGMATVPDVVRLTIAGKPVDLPVR